MIPAMMGARMARYTRGPLYYHLIERWSRNSGGCWSSKASFTDWEDVVP